MKNISIRIAAIIFGIALAWGVVSCAGRITVGEGEDLAPSQEQLQALIDQAQVPAQSTDISEVPGEETVDKYPNVQRVAPSLAPISNTWIMMYGFLPDQDPQKSPNFIASADFSAKMYKDNAADLTSELFQKVLKKYGISFDDALVAVFYRSPRDNYPASWLVAFMGVDVNKIKDNLEKIVENENVLYKGPDFYLAEIEDIKLIGSKDYLLYALGFDGQNIVRAYLEANVAPFRIIASSPKLAEKVFGFLKPASVEANKVPDILTSINAKYFADKKEIELTANYYLYQINQATAVYKFDSSKFDWKRFVQMLGEFIGVEEKVIMKDEATNVSPTEQDSLKYDQDKDEEMNMPANVNPGEANY